MVKLADDPRWKNADSLSSHPYTDLKGITPKSVKLDQHGNLLIPIRTPDANLAGFQTISETGEKQFVKGTKFKGNYLPIGIRKSVIYIVEGYADGVTVWETTEEAAVIAFNADNLLAVAKNLREKLPDTKFVLVADNDADKKHNIGVTKATAAALAVDGYIAIPSAQDGTKVDINDLMLKEGQEAVRKLLEAAEKPTPPPLHDCVLVTLADVESKPIRWLWPSRFPLGKLCLIGGPPSKGKTQIALWIAANVTTGGKWPDSDEHAVIGDALILSTEDDVADTIKPRLEAAGADVSRVHVLQAVQEARDDEVCERQFNLSRHIRQVTDLLKTNPKIRLIILDPLSAYLGVKDSHRDSDVREVLGPLAQLAADYGVTVIGIVHLNKTQSSDPMARFIGSTGIIASARSAYLVYGDDDD